MMPTKGCRRRISDRTSEGSAAPDLFGRLVRIMKANEALLLDLKAMDARLGAARAYLAEPDSHLPLALGTLAHLKTKRAGLLTLLRAGRIAAEAIVGPIDPAGVSPTP